jgi:hypothetical protein
MTLYEHILDTMLSDDDKPEHISECLIEAYEIADEHDRNVMDMFMMTLTGWSLKTFIDNEEE